MKKLALIAAFCTCAFLFLQCKTAQTTAPETGPAPSVLEVHMILDSAESRFVHFADSTNGDPWLAIQLTTDWLLNQPNVQNAYYLDSTYITIQLTSGLETGFYLDLLNDSGYSMFRGGGSRSVDLPTLVQSGTPAQNTIENMKVLIFAADTKSLPAVNGQIQRTVDRLNSSGLGFDVTVLKDEQCSYGVVETFGNYGLVLMDTHGTNNSFLVGSTLDLSAAPKTEDGVKSVIDNEAGAGTAARIAAGELKLVATVKADVTQPNWQHSFVPNEDRQIYFTSKYLDLLPPMPNTIILGNMCYSGSTATSFYMPVWRLDTLFAYKNGVQTNQILKIITRGGGTVQVKDPIRPAFERRSLISYYGYIRDDPAGSSRPVPDVFAAAMEDSLVKRLVDDLDSTKIANLQADNQTEYFDPPHPSEERHKPGLLGNLYLRHFGADDYSYEKCGRPFTDARDGQVYKTVCLGTQVWMAQNLNYDVSGATCYDNSSTLCTTYGKLYDWNTLMAGASATDANPSGVQGICPKGWHVPSAGEWTTLETFLGGSAAAGGAMKSTNALWNAPNAGATNSSGFSAYPGGRSNRTSGPPFIDIGNAAYFWTTTNDATTPTPRFYWLSTNLASGQLQSLQSSGKDNAMSCRCVQDK